MMAKEDRLRRSQIIYDKDRRMVAEQWILETDRINGNIRPNILTFLLWLNKIM